jgi:hypothetical protein
MAEQEKSMTCFRLAPEVRAALDHYCLANNVSVTEFYRSMTDAFLTGAIGPGAIDGYKQGRSMAVQLAGALLQRAALELPETLEEAIARYGIVG